MEMIELLERYLFLLCISHGHVAKGDQGPGGSMSQVVGLPNNSYKPITNMAWVCIRLCKLQKGCTRLAAKSDKFTSCLPMVGGSLRVLPLLLPLKLILLKVALSTINQSINQSTKGYVSFLASLGVHHKHHRTNLKQTGFGMVLG